ncbi:tail fiber protein [Orpheovirus IHUMI-LCC2]|uniref:Phage Tail Collar domain-containing protein n=1 Tax=Orpheovirus IHUMI-LCC2 TaxID=2023057 RepID=A0A2I2L5Q4_9VIRU|nr:tail fiber protein [Orpheovirus IHUMI-LCC2]SNW62857.1 Phage Tail Collar domain-containing protein [Orpheovirus IHUMI-LCC2]
MSKRCCGYEQSCNPCCPDPCLIYQPWPIPTPPIPVPPPPQILTGNGAPTLAIGTIGSLYLDLTNGNLYARLATGWVLVNSASTATANVPIGAAIDFSGTTIPTGFVLANGATLPVTTYPQLYAAIGNTFGGVPGVTYTLPTITSGIAGVSVILRAF